MQTEVIMSGFGGQGLMMIGKLLAKAALDEGREVTWLPSYGPEMRGGTANCTVVVADRPIGSPLISSPSAALIMNQPSLEKFGPAVKPGGVLVVNSSMVPVRSGRKDLRSFRIRANHVAMEKGNGRAANLVMLGALLGIEEVVSRETLLKAIEKAFANKKKFIQPNCKCFLEGFERARAGQNDE